MPVMKRTRHDDVRQPAAAPAGAAITTTKPLPSSLKKRQPLRSALASRSSPSPSSPSTTTATLDSPRSSFSTPVAGPARPNSEGYRRGMFTSYVQNALQARNEGDMRPYHELLAQFQPPAPGTISSTSATPAQLLSWLPALGGFASQLDRRAHGALVEAVLNLPWTTMGGDQLARAWIRFVCALVSARGEWINPVLTRAVKALSYRSDAKAIWYGANAPNDLGSPSSTTPTRRQIYARTHHLLRSLLVLIPTLPSLLAPLIIQHFPLKREGKAAHVVYIRNALEVCSYCEELAQTVLECVMDRALQIDVEIQVELDELEEETNEAGGLGEEEDLDPFDRAADDDNSSSEGDSDDDEELGDGFDVLSDDEDDAESAKRNDPSGALSIAEAEKKLKHVKDMVAKLDALMEVMFAHLESLNARYLAATTQVAPPPSASASLGPDSLGALPSIELLGPSQALALRSNLFQLLLAIFQRAVLPTFKSRHVQFLLFYHASLDADFSDLLLGTLLSKAIYGVSDGSIGPESMYGAPAEREEPPIMRVAAASYVASLVSRASYISAEHCRAVVLNLCAFLEAHLEAFGTTAPVSPALTIDPYAASNYSTTSGPHAVFYAVSQAVLYIFCFRWRDLQGATTSGGGAGRARAARQSGGQGVAGSGPSSSGTSSNGVGAGSADAFRGAFGTTPSSGPAASSYASDEASNDHLVIGMGGGIASGNSAGGSTSTPSSTGWAEGLSTVQRAITSALNPLAHCSPTVVKQFAGVAQHTGFLYCWSIIESNARRGGGGAAVARRNVNGGGSGGASGAETPKTSSSSGRNSPATPRPSNRGLASQQSQLGGAFPPSSSTSSLGGSSGMPTPWQQPSSKHSLTTNSSSSSLLGGSQLALPPPPIGTEVLDVFFPFDPYRLKASSKWVEPLYREWADVAPEGMLDDDEEDSSEDESEYDASESEDEREVKSAALGIPGRGLGTGGKRGDDEGDQVASSFEAMSISPSPGAAGFGHGI